MDLHASRMLVVGGSSGIGRAVAHRAAAAGAHVTIAGRSAARLARAAAGRPIETLVLDLTDADSISAALAAHGPVDHLVLPGSGDAVVGPLLALDLAAAQRFMDSKLWGPIRAVRAARVGRSITLFSGAASRKVAAGASTTSMINAAVEALGASLAVELAPLRVNVIAPGFIDTPVWETLLPPAERAALFASLAERLPARRLGTADEVAAATLAVVSNPYMSGSVVFVDGGYART